MKTIPVYICGILLAAGLNFNAASAAETAPDALVKATTEEVLAVIKQTSDPRQLTQVAESKVLPHFDFKRMTRLAVGQGWNKASPEQQQALEKEFRNLLVRTYTNALASGKHKDVTLEVSPLRADAGATEVMVKTRVSSAGNKPVPIDYQMEKTAAGWKVYDVVVSGISLVTNYRDSFASEVSKSGIDGLLKLMTAKNQARAEARS